MKFFCSLLVRFNIKTSTPSFPPYCVFFLKYISSINKTIIAFTNTSAFLVLSCILNGLLFSESKQMEQTFEETHPRLIVNDGSGEGTKPVRCEHGLALL